MSTPTVIYVRKLKWYVRIWRWFTRRKVNGSEQLPYRTLSEAMRDVPRVIPVGQHYVIDMTGSGMHVMPKGAVIDALSSDNEERK